jgi:hypothetical protein
VCGKIYTPDQNTDAFCSDFCSKQFERCDNCGRYYEVGTGTGDGVCSTECSQRYELKGARGKYVLSEEVG